MRSTDHGAPHYVVASDDYSTKTTQKYFINEDGHHRIHSACGPCCTEHDLRERNSTCQQISGDRRGTLRTLLVTFCIVIVRCTETFWSPCITRITGTLHEGQYTFFIIPCYILYRMRNFEHKIFRENQNTNFMLNNFFSIENRAVENVREPDRPQVTIRRMRIKCWIPKATDTHSEYVI
jgi:hypothetical protein